MQHCFLDTERSGHGAAQEHQRKGGTKPLATQAGCALHAMLPNKGGGDISGSMPGRQLLHADGHASQGTHGRAPGVLRDLSHGDALGGVGREHARQQVLALGADMQRLLEVGRHNAREHLLQPHQVVPAVVPALGERQHAWRRGSPGSTRVHTSPKRCKGVIDEQNWFTGLLRHSLATSPA